MCFDICIRRRRAGELGVMCDLCVHDIAQVYFFSQLRYFSDSRAGISS
jgi:hypothetical protein